MEEWLSIEGFPLYEVSSVGRIRRIAPTSNHPHYGILKPGKMGSGRKQYLGVGLSNGTGTLQRKLVHRLVAAAFIGPAPSPTHQVNHLNGDTQHNAAENLEWVTPSDNQRHSYRTGLARPGANLHLGERHHSARLNEESVRELRSLAGTMSQEALGRRFGIAQASVSKVLRRASWKNVS